MKQSVGGRGGVIVLLVLGGLLGLWLLLRALLGPSEEIVLAILGQDGQRVKRLMDEGLDPNAHVKSGSLPIQVAILHGNPEIVTILMDSGADPALPNRDGRDAWEEAWHRAERVDPTAGQCDCLELLLSAGYRPKSISLPKDRTLLHLVAEKTRRAGLVTTLVKSMELDVNCRDQFGWTPLHVAANARNRLACEALVEIGADVNAETTLTLENEARKEYERILQHNRDNEDNELSALLPFDSAKKLPGEMLQQYYLYQKGSRPLDVTSTRLVRQDPLVRKFLESQGGTSNPEVNNVIQGEAPATQY